MSLPRFVVCIFGIGLMVLGAGVSGQDYPNKPVRIVTALAGGGNDFVARVIAQALTGPLGQQVIVDNRGASVLAAEAVSRAAPDGYTLLIDGESLWMVPLLQRSASDPLKDFAPISLTTRAPNFLVVHPSLPVRSVKELIALAKARPGELNYASGSTGGSTHISTELFKSMAGVNIVRIPYKGTGTAINDLLGGQVLLMFGPAAAVMPHVKAGKLRALAATIPSAQFPEVPTLAASLPGYEHGLLAGLLAPARTPVAIIKRLHQEIVQVLKTPEVKERFSNAGVETVGNSPEEFAAAIKSEMAKMVKLINDAGLRPE